MAKVTITIEYEEKTLENGWIVVRKEPMISISEGSEEVFKRSIPIDEYEDDKDLQHEDIDEEDNVIVEFNSELMASSILDIASAILYEEGGGEDDEDDEDENED